MHMTCTYKRLLEARGVNLHVIQTYTKPGIRIVNPRIWAPLRVGVLKNVVQLSLSLSQPVGQDGQLGLLDRAMACSNVISTMARSQKLMAMLLGMQR